MYNRDLIIEKLKPYLCFREEQGFTLPVGLKTTLASRRMNQRYPLLTLKNLDLSRPEGLTLDEFLESTREMAIDKAIQDIYVHKRISENVKGTLSKSSSLYEVHIGNLKQQSTTSGKFVGIKIYPTGSEYYRIHIDRFCLTTLSSQELTLYVYHSSNLFEPVEEFTVNATKAGSPTWVTPDTEFNLDFFNVDIDRGGFYYVGVKTDELLPGNVLLGRNYEWAKRICGTCSYADKKYQDSWYGFTKMNSVVGDVTGNAIGNVSESDKMTYGINLAFTIQCDLTRLLADQADVVSELAQLNYCAALLGEMNNSTRLNREAAIVSERAYSELNGEWNTAGRAKAKIGVLDIYAEKLKAVSFDLSELGDRCVPSDKKRGILYWG